MPLLHVRKLLIWWASCPTPLYHLCSQNGGLGAQIVELALPCPHKNSSIFFASQSQSSEAAGEPTSCVATNCLGI